MASSSESQEASLPGRPSRWLSSEERDFTLEDFDYYSDSRESAPEADLELPERRCYVAVYRWLKCEHIKERGKMKALCAPCKDHRKLGVRRCACCAMPVMWVPKGKEEDDDEDDDLRVVVRGDVTVDKCKSCREK